MTTKAKSINIFFALILLIIFVSMLTIYTDSNTVLMSMYGVEVVFIAYSLHYINKYKKITANEKKWSRIIIALAIITSLLNMRGWLMLLKAIGYVAVFLFAKTQVRNKLNLSAVKKEILYPIIFTPLLLVFFFDNSIYKNMFFPQSNTFVYYGIMASFLFYSTYYVELGNKKILVIISILILLAYLLVGTSLGIMVAAFLSFVLISIKKIKTILALFAASIVLLISIYNIDIPVFERIRTIIEVATSISRNEYLNLANIDLYQSTQNFIYNDEGRTDHLSFLWRFIHWDTIVSNYPDLGHIFNYMFGFGDGYVSQKFNNDAHNDYLGLLVQYGICCFICIMILIKKAIVLLKTVPSKYGIFVVYTVLLYHLTENLTGNFPANIIFYYLLGNTVALFENKTSKKIETSTFNKNYHVDVCLE